MPVRSLPIIAPQLRTSERKDFKRCQQKWWWAWREGLVTPFHKADALWFGIGMHLAFQERYKYKGLRRGTQMLKVWRDYVGDEVAYVRTLPDSNFVDEEPVWVEAGALGEAMIGAYLDKYGKDPRWHVVATEHAFSAAIPRPGLLGQRQPTLIEFLSRFDLVARDLESERSDLWLWDHKTAKAIFTLHLTLDDQAGAYWALAADVLAHQGLIKKGDTLTGILYNFARKAKPDERPRNAEGLSLNKDGSVSKVQPSPLFVREEVHRSRAERATQIRRIQNEALQMEALRRQPELLTKTPTKDCRYDCQFFDLCELDESGAAADAGEYRDAMFRVRNPYDAYRESTAV